MADATCKTCPFFEVARVPDDKDVKGWCHHISDQAEGRISEEWWCSEHPLRQRDRLAAMAMQGLVAAAKPGERDPSDVAVDAYMAADAMLAEAAKAQG